MAATHHDELRQWARGDRTLVAATELLIRAAGGRFAGQGQPWVLWNGTNGFHWVDFKLIPGNVGALSGGETRLLLLAASISGAGVEVNVGQMLSGLDRETVELILAAVAYAAGGDALPVVEQHADGTASLKRLPSPFPWPAG